MGQPDRRLNTFETMVRWAIEEAGGFCPSAERLARYAREPDAVDLRDVRYHVEEAGCRLCRVELAELQADKAKSGEE